MFKSKKVWIFHFGVISSRRMFRTRLRLSSTLIYSNLENGILVILTLAFFWNSSTSILNKSRSSFDILYYILDEKWLKFLVRKFKRKRRCSIVNIYLSLTLSISKIKEIYKLFKIYTVTRLKTCDFNHSYQKLHPNTHLLVSSSSVTFSSKSSKTSLRSSLLM
jgi:hypothetical protein